jgi:hypothetical protein
MQAYKQDLLFIEQLERQLLDFLSPAAVRCECRVWLTASNLVPAPQTYSPANSSSHLTQA